MKLINKKWGMFSNEWLIPQEGQEANLAKRGSSKVYGQGQKKDCNYGPKVKPQRRGQKYKNCQTPDDNQQWIRSTNDIHGYFTLKNKATGLLLTAENNKTLIVTGIIQIFNDNLKTKRHAP